MQRPRVLTPKTNIPRQKTLFTLCLQNIFSDSRKSGNAAVGRTPLNMRFQRIQVGLEPLRINPSNLTNLFVLAFTYDVLGIGKLTPTLIFKFSSEVEGSRSCLHSRLLLDSLHYPWKSLIQSTLAYSARMLLGMKEHSPEAKNAHTLR